ncbi:MAG: LysM peptidoglycan-binding domain-containing protein [Paramuribaculum sp.]|nr:LysM peptidoglycan-binding domain-containing protein [Paramuribaculum sp.]
MVLKRMVLAAMAAIVLSVSAQSPIDNLPVKIINGTAYRYYEVGAKETIYSIARKFEISQDELMRLNPSVADGLKAGQTLYFPVSEGSSARIHTVKSKETLYGIGKMYGVTPEQLCEWNPGAVDGIRAGEQLIVSAPVQLLGMPVQQTITVENPEAYIIKDGETLYSIAIAKSTTVDAILAANPGLDRNNYQAGTVIALPLSSQTGLTELVEAPVAVVIKESETAPVDTAALPVIYSQVEDTAPAEETVVDSVGAINIAITLPFMLSGDEQSRQAQLYTEFYKGFLLAVDEMRDCGTPINIITFDSSDPAGIDGILADARLRNAGVIISSDTQTQLDAIGKFGRENGIDVLNLFVVKDEDYLTNPALMQGNIPHHAMYEKAIDGLMKKIGSHIPVILTRNNGEKDKEEYIGLLKAKLTAAGIEFKEIAFDGTMSASALEELDADKQYAFIPGSGKQVELNRVLPAIIEFKSLSTVIDPVMVFGYPEWITFRGETLTNMHKANCVVYSRFFTDSESATVKQVENRFNEWYGTQMANFMPRQGLFGYDAGMFVINWLRSGSKEPVDWEGLQNGFDFESIPGGGKVNGKLYFINYLPGGLIDKTSL